MKKQTLQETAKDILNEKKVQIGKPIWGQKVSDQDYYKFIDKKLKKEGMPLTSKWNTRGFSGNISMDIPVKGTLSKFLTNSPNLEGTFKINTMGYKFYIVLTLYVHIENEDGEFFSLKKQFKASDEVMDWSTDDIVDTTIA
jgi:hypothetical protein